MPQYLLLTIGWYNRFWWKVEQAGLNCTADQRESVLSSSLAVTDEVFLDAANDVNLTTTAGIVGQNQILMLAILLSLAIIINSRLVGNF